MRMGTQKLLLQLHGKRMIEHVLEAASAYDTIVVASSEVAAELSGRNDARVITNAEPERGMAHSLALANVAVPAGAALLVFLGDKPFVTPQLAASVVDAALAHGADVAFPERAGTGGHPVFFSPRARGRFGGTGDSLREVRDDPALVRLPLPIEDDGAYLDIDEPPALSRALEQP